MQGRFGFRRHTLALAAAASCAAITQSAAFAQVATGWKGTAGNANWSTAANWDNPTPPTARDLFFGVGWVNAGRIGSTTSNNDLVGYHGHKIFFENIANPVTFTLTGNSIELFDFGGATPVYPQIQNSSGAAQVFNIAVTLHDTSADARGEVNASNGDLIFNQTVDLAGITQLQAWGNNGKTLAFNAPITSTGNTGSNSFAINANTNVIIRAACTYIGQTFVNAGKLQFDTGGSLNGTIRLGSTSGTASAAVDLISPTGDITVNRTINPRAGTTGNTLSFNSLNASGVNTYSGHFGLDHDLLVAQSTGGTLNITQLRINETDTVTGFDIKGFTNTFFANGDIHVSGTIYNSTGSGTVIKNGAGVLTFSSTNTYAGTTTVNEGTLQLGAGATSGSIAAGSNVTSTGVGGTLAFNRSDSVTFANAIGGNVALAQVGSGTTILTGINTSTGPTSISAGTLQVGAGTTGGSPGSGAISNNGALAINRSDVATLSTTISGTGLVSHLGSGTTTLVDHHTYTGHTYVAAGTLQIGSGAIPTSLQTDEIVNNANVTTGGILDLNLPMTISGGGALHHYGSATLTISGNNPYSGGTNVNSGTVVVAHSSALGNGGLITRGTGNVVMNSGLVTAVKVASLSISSPTTVDLNDNSLAVDAATPTSAVVDYIRTARNGGAWNGTGLTSTAALNHPTNSKTLGVLSGAEFHGLYGAATPFAGVQVADCDTLVKFTWYGDTDFNDKVDGADYARIDTSFNNQSAQGDIGGWFNGDLDFNGKVDGADYALIDSAFNSQTAGPAGAPSDAASRPSNFAPEV